MAARFPVAVIALGVVMTCLLMSPAAARRGRRLSSGSGCTAPQTLVRSTSYCNSASTPLDYSCGSGANDKVAKCGNPTEAKFCYGFAVGNSFDLYVKDAANQCPSPGCKWTGTVGNPGQQLTCSPTSQNAICKVTYTKGADGTYGTTTLCSFSELKDGATWPSCLNVVVSGNCITVTPACKAGLFSHIAISNVGCCTCKAKAEWTWPTLPSGDQCRDYTFPAAIASVDTGCGVVDATTPNTGALGCNSQTATYTATCPSDATLSDTKDATVNIQGGAISWASDNDGTVVTDPSAQCPDYTNPQLYAKQECDDTWTPVDPAVPTLGCNTNGAQTVTYSYTGSCSQSGTKSVTVDVSDDGFTSTADSGCGYTWSTRCLTSPNPPTLKDDYSVENCVLTTNYDDVQDACQGTHSFDPRTFTLSNQCTAP